MILKIEKLAGTGGSYFECTHFHYECMLFDNIRKGDYLRLFHDNKPPENVKRIVLEPDIGRTILTDRVVYVLNDEGKTIDRF